VSRKKGDDLLFKALADSRRRRMLDLLKDGPRTTGEICGHFRALDRCTVMQHLGVLENAELIIVKREGRRRWNYFNPLPIRELHDRWISRFAVGAVDLLARMKREMETPPSGEPLAARAHALRAQTAHLPAGIDLHLVGGRGNLAKRRSGGR
jgi:DNA-binding transcriptional ArsR family regulator